MDNLTLLTTVPESFLNAFPLRVSLAPDRLLITLEITFSPTKDNLALSLVPETLSALPLSLSLLRPALSSLIRPSLLPSIPEIARRLTYGNCGVTLREAKGVGDLSENETKADRLQGPVCFEADSGNSVYIY